MNIYKYIFYILLIIDCNNAYQILPCVYNRKYKNIKRLRKKCECIKNATEYVLEILIIIDILLPKKLDSSYHSSK